MKNKKITFDDVIRGDGNGYIYSSDVDLWLGINLGVKKRDEIKDALYKIREKLNESKDK